jgi:hypothetical protein
MRGRREVLAGDLFHPSAVGYAVWADVIAGALLDRSTNPDSGLLLSEGPLRGEPSGA